MEKDYLKTLGVSIEDEKGTELLLKALNCKTRRSILMLLEDGPLSIWRIAQLLDVPLSTVSEHIALLIKAGLVSVVRKEHGSKIVSRQYERIAFSMFSNGENHPRFKVRNIQIPIGSYSSFEIRRYCGMLSEEGYIGRRDDADSFYSPLHHKKTCPNTSPLSLPTGHSGSFFTGGKTSCFFCKKIKKIFIKRYVVCC